jgi:hypothetical protein
MRRRRDEHPSLIGKRRSLLAQLVVAVKDPDEIV